MRDFYAPTGAVPLDQADGLRRLFAAGTAPGLRVLPLVANPHVAFSGIVLDRLAAQLALQGRQVLVVDAGGQSPQPGEMAWVELSMCVERVAPNVAYLPARGLPLAFVDTRGSAAHLLQALAEAVPEADVVLLHAEASDLARVLGRQAARPLLLGADHTESIKHAYAGAKLLARRCGLMTFDLLLATAMQCPRGAAIAGSVADCLDGFIGALLHRWAFVDPAATPADPGDASGQGDTPLHQLLAAQLALEGGPPAGPGSALPARPPAPAPVPATVPAPRAARHTTQNMNRQA